MRLLWQRFITWVCEQRTEASEPNAEFCAPSQAIKELLYRNDVLHYSTNKKDQNENQNDGMTD